MGARPLTDGPYANIRQFLGFLEGKRLESITQHDADEFAEGEQAYVELGFEGGGTVRFIVEGFVYNNPDEPDDEPGVD